MSRIPVSTATGERPDVDAGIYMATCVRVKDDFIENPQFGEGDIVRLYFELKDKVDGEGDPVTLDGMASRKISPKSKLTRWADALGRHINFDDPDEDFDTEELVGAECQIKVTRKDAESWPKVEDVIALPKGTGSRKDDDMAEWWQNILGDGFTRDAVVAKSQEMFDNREPKNLTKAERTQLAKAMT